MDRNLWAARWKSSIEARRTGRFVVACTTSPSASANVVLPAAERQLTPTRVGCPSSRLVIQSTIGRSGSIGYDHSRRRVLLGFAEMLTPTQRSEDPSRDMHRQN